MNRHKPRRTQVRIPERTLKVYVGQYPGHTAEFYARQLERDVRSVNNELAELVLQGIIRQSWSDYDTTPPTYAPRRFYGN